MDRLHYEEMLNNLDILCKEKAFVGKNVFLFGHCEATERLIDEFFYRNIPVKSILDNNIHKQGNMYRDIIIHDPRYVMSNTGKESVVCIVARAFASMKAQLLSMGFEGDIYRLATYDTFADYSLDADTIVRMYQREQRGEIRLNDLKHSFPNGFFFLCPFAALGDIYYMMAFMPIFLKQRGIEQARVVVAVVGKSSQQVVRLFGLEKVCLFQQTEIDEMIQAALFTEDRDVFIPHQDRPYTVNLSRALYQKNFSLMDLYRYGIYGLESNCEPCTPLIQRYEVYPYLGEICKDKAVIVSPYAKSVPMLPIKVWKVIIEYFQQKGYQVFTNVASGEIPLPQTTGISPTLSALKCVVEKAGIFIGLRSGLCDILQDAKCLKIALYPEYFYTDTKWTAHEIYALPGWENVLVKENFTIDILRGVLGDV